MNETVAFPKKNIYYQDVVEALSYYLQHGDEADKCYTAKAFSKIKDKSIVPLLIDNLGHEDEDVCIDAITALGDIKDESVVSILLEGLSIEVDGNVLVSIVEALANIGTNSAINALIELVNKSPDQLVDLDEDWDTYWDLQLESVKALGDLKVESATKELVKLLNNEDSQDIESDILNSLAKIPNNGNKVLFNLFETSSSRTRRRIIIALSNSNRLNKDIINKALTDKSPDVNKEILIALEKHSIIGYFEQVLELMLHIDDNVRLVAMSTALSFSKLINKPELIIKLLKPMISDPHQEVRIKALEYYKYFIQQGHVKEFDVALIERVKKLCYSNSSIEAIHALNIIALAKIDNCDEFLIDVINHEEHDPMVLRESVILLGIVGKFDDQTSQLFDSLILHNNQSVRLAVLSAINNLIQVDIDNGNHALEYLYRIVRRNPESEIENEAPIEIDSDVESNNDEEFDNADGDTNDTIRSTLDSIMQTSKLNEKFIEDSDVTTLEQNLENIPEDVKEYGDIVKEHLTSLTPLLNRKYISVENDVRVLAIRLLTDKPDDQTKEVIFSLLDDKDVKVRAEAISALKRAKLEPNQVNIITKSIASSNSEISIQATKTLAQVCKKNDIQIFIDALSSSHTEVRIQALLAINRFIDKNDTEIIKRVEDLLQDSEYGVRSVVIKILTKLDQYHLAEKIISSGVVDGGALSRVVTESIKTFPQDVIFPVLLDKIRSVKSSAQRRFVIEMIGDICV
jgi:HEAT repeat protein